MLDYLALLLFIAAAALVAAGMLSAAIFLGPKRPHRVKSRPFACGGMADPYASEQFSLRYYLVAMLFILFDLEVVFLYFWGVIFRDLGAAGFVDAVLFILILGAGLAYVWRRGALRWV